MLIKAKTLEGFKLDSLDGEIGKVKEFYFDDRHWTIRYLVAETGTWLAGRQVLISPYALSSVNDISEMGCFWRFSAIGFQAIGLPLCIYF